MLKGIRISNAFDGKVAGYMLIKGNQPFNQQALFNYEEVPVESVPISSLTLGELNLFLTDFVIRNSVYIQ